MKIWRRVLLLNFDLPYEKGRIVQAWEIQHCEDPIDGGIYYVGAILKFTLSRGECMSVDCIFH